MATRSHRSIYESRGQEPAAPGTADLQTKKIGTKDLRTEFLQLLYIYLKSCEKSDVFSVRPQERKAPDDVSQTFHVLLVVSSS